MTLALNVYILIPSVALDDTNSLNFNMVAHGIENVNDETDNEHIPKWVSKTFNYFSAVSS